MVIGWLYTALGCMVPGQQGGMHKGGFSGAICNPSCGGSRPVLAAWGEPARPGFPPEGETGKGEFQIPCCRRQLPVEPTAEGGFRVSPRKPLQPLESRNSPIG